jgi:N-methylhydantoinase B/oxoprolinase/acetone carboxylase alpha subunit
MSVSTAMSTTMSASTSMSTTMSASASAINSKEDLDLVPNIFTQQGDSEIEAHLATNDEPSRQCCGYSN